MRDGLVRARYWVLAAWGLLLMVYVVHRAGGKAGDWGFFTQGYDLLVHGYVVVPHRYFDARVGGGGLHLYAQHPSLQIGPLALCLTRIVTLLNDVNRYLAPTLLVLTGVATIRGVERIALRVAPHREPEIGKVVFVAGIFVMFAWVQALVQWRHIDDMLVLIGMTVAVAAIIQRKPWVLGIAIGLSVAAKPTALILLPLLFAMTWRENVKALIPAGVLIVGCWLPFVVADPATLHAGAAQIPIRPGSGLTALGYLAGTVPPRAIRAAQLIVALVGGGAAVLRGRWYLVPLIGFGLRTALDPSVASYYAISIVFAGLVADVIPAPRAPINTLVAWLAFSEPFGMLTSYWPELPDSVQAWIRLGVPVGLTVALLVSATRPPSSHAAQLGAAIPPLDEQPAGAAPG